jgi:hypothetical protein
MKKYKTKSMAFFNRRRSFGRRSFRPRYNNNRRSFRSYRPSLGINKILRSPILILFALVGGALYLFRDKIQPLIDKLKSHTA